jgi:hypothetical protein
MPVETTESSQLTQSAPTGAPRSRRSILGAAIGGVAASIAALASRPQPVSAAAGDALIIGSTTNNAGTSNTILSTSSTVVAFQLLQNGQGTALMGHVTPSSGTTRGVYGRTDSPNGDGVQARNAGATGSGAAVRAFGGNNIGVVATSSGNDGFAIYGTHTSNGAGVRGISASGLGVYGSSTSWTGVAGASSTGTGVSGTASSIGVNGSASGEFGVGVNGTGSGSSGHGVSGTITNNSITASGVYGQSAGSNSFAGYFAGHVAMTADLSVDVNLSVGGTLSKGGGSFRIDHPLDPANRILQHSFVESPDMLNLYDGVVSADAQGEATVSLPAWFMALNRDFRYSLTPIGAFAPLYVKAKVSDGRFTIAGAQPGQEVSWQLTGIRQDAWANANRIEVELDKTGDQRGRYLHPVAHGQPLSAGVAYPLRQAFAAGHDRASG